MALVSTIIQAGLHSAVPAAASANTGYLYYETDTQKLFRSNGSAWVQVAAAANASYDASAIDGTGTFKLSGDISPSQITSNQNDYNPTGLSTASVLRLNTDASRNITSLAGGADGRIIVIVNVGSFNIVLKDDDGATGTAGNRFALSGDITLAPDDGVILQYDSTSSRWRCIGKSPGAAGGSGAATTNKYVTTAAAGDLSAEVAIPGLNASPDIKGSGGAGTSEEYDSGTTGLTWSSAPATEDSNTTVLDHLYLKWTDGTERFGTKAWAPGSGAFDVRTKVALNCDAGVAALYLLISDSGNSNRTIVGIDFSFTSRTATISAYTYAGSYTQRGSSWTVSLDSFIYLRTARDGSNNVTFYFSLNGILWIPIATQSFTFTVAKLGYRTFNSAGSNNSQAIIDWLRTSV